MTSKNTRYATDGVIQWLDGYRDKWDDFYRSEQWAFDKIASANGNSLGRVLDVGCGMAGLGVALAGRFQLKEYYGVDINPQNIARAEANRPKIKAPVVLQCCDMLEINGIPKASFDTVVSLSCVDWNIETRAMIDTCWTYVKPGGYFVMSVRLADKGINDVAQSYQIIKTNDKGKPAEVANYVVFGAKEFFESLKSFSPRPSNIYGFGYWGKPSDTAVTPYKELVFGVVIAQKSISGEVPTNMELDFPLEHVKPARAGREQR